MGSPLGPTLANAFLYERKWLEGSLEFKPVFTEDMLIFLFNSNQPIIS